jgi:hypothetical protein
MKIIFILSLLLIVTNPTLANEKVAPQSVEDITGGKSVEEWLNEIQKKSDDILEETSKSLKKLDSLLVKFYQILELMLRHELSKKEAFFVSMSQASIYTNSRRKVIFNKVTGEFNYADDVENISNEKTLYLGDVKNNVLFETTELEKAFKDYQKLKSDLEATSNDSSDPFYSLTSIAPIQGFKGTSLRVTSTTTKQGFSTELKDVQFEFRRVLDFDELQTSKLSIIPTLHQDSELYDIAPFTRDVVFTNLNKGVSALVISGHVKEAYAGLSGANKVSVGLEVLSRDSQHNKLVPPTFEKICLDNYKPHDDSNDSVVAKLMAVFDITQSIYVSMNDIVAKKKNGELMILPLTSRLDCRVKDISGALKVEMKETTLLSSYLFSNKHKDLMSPSDFFGSRRIAISAINSETSELYNLVELPNELLIAIKKTYMDTITQHELDFMDEKGELK